MKRCTPRASVFGLLFLTALLLFAPGTARADGTETLGPPSIAIADGTGMVAAGTGLMDQPGTIDITVPDGVSIEQVLLYWAGGAVGVDNAGDDTLTIAGNSVTGTLIGGPSFFFGDFYFAAYRADVTALNLVTTGANSLTVSDLDFSAEENGGAGLVVIYDDGINSTMVQIRDGLDLAYFNFPEPRQTTVAQTFDFDAATEDRQANLVMFFASVADDRFRPSSIEVTVGGETTLFSDLLGSNDGPQWDTVDIPHQEGITVTIPAGATSLTVQAFSREDGDSDAQPASFTWIGTGLSVLPLQPPALLTLGDYVWYDQNADGIQDAGEPGLNGITVNLYANADCTGDPQATTTTANGGDPAVDGFYSFGDLTEGAYCVAFIVPDGMTVSPQDQGDGANDSSGDANGMITNINLTADDPDEDLGLYARGTLGDSVMCVTTSEPMADIGVSVAADFDCDGAADGEPLATTSTDGQGLYGFTDLEIALAGDPNNSTCYVVVVDTEDPDLGICNIPASQTSYNPELDTDNRDDPNNDFLFAQPDAGEDLTLGDYVWYDQNADGIQDENEPGLNDVVVNLYANADCSGEPQATTATANGGDPAADGFYSFTGLDAGAYCVAFVSPDGMTVSPQDQGDGANDSSADTDGMITNITLTQDDPDQDAGFYARGTLGDSVMCVSTNEPLADIGVAVSADFNCDGAADGEPFATTSTAAQGLYGFADLEIALAGDPDNGTCYVVAVATDDPELGDCDVPASQTSYNPELDTDTPDDPNNDFEFSLQPTALDRDPEPGLMKVYIPLVW